MSLRPFVPSILVAGLIGLLPSTASATAISFHFTVNVTEVGGIAATLFPTLGAGDVLTGQFTFDSDTPNGSSNPNPMFGTYVYTPPPVPPFTTFVDVQGQRLSWSGSRVFVIDTPAFDVYGFENDGVASLPPGLSTARFLGQFNGGGGAQLTSNALPLDPLNPLLFATRTFTLTLGPDSGPDRIRGTVSAMSVAVTPVPEPATLACVATGLVTLISARRRLRRARQHSAG